MLKRYAISVDYHQFYLWDHGAQPEPPTLYDDTDVANRIKAEPFVVVIQPERDNLVPVEVEVLEHAPDADFAAWDHVAEASLALPSGRLELHECTGGSIDILPVPPGIYRVRGYFGGLGTLRDDDLDGDDHYRVVLWPAPVADVAVLKHYTADRAGGA